MNLRKSLFRPRKVVFSAILACFALFGYWFYVAVEMERAKFFSELNFNEFNDFNLTRYVMIGDNITDAQYNEISQGLDH